MWSVSDGGHTQTGARPMDFDISPSPDSTRILSRNLNSLPSPACPSSGPRSGPCQPPGRLPSRPRPSAPYRPPTRAASSTYLRVRQPRARSTPRSSRSRLQRPQEHPSSTARRRPSTVRVCSTRRGDQTGRSMLILTVLARSERLAPLPPPSPHRQAPEARIAQLPSCPARVHAVDQDGRGPRSQHPLQHASSVDRALQAVSSPCWN